MGIWRAALERRSGLGCSPATLLLLITEQAVHMGARMRTTPTPASSSSSSSSERSWWPDAIWPASGMALQRTTGQELPAWARHPVMSNGERWRAASDGIGLQWSTWSCWMLTGTGRQTAAVGRQQSRPMARHMALEREPDRGLGADDLAIASRCNQSSITADGHNKLAGRLLVHVALAAAALGRQRV